MSSIAMHSSMVAGSSNGPDYDRLLRLGKLIEIAGISLTNEYVWRGGEEVVMGNYLDGSYSKKVMIQAAAIVSDSEKTLRYGRWIVAHDKTFQYDSQWGVGDDIHKWAAKNPDLVNTLYDDGEEDDKGDEEDRDLTIIAERRQFIRQVANVIAHYCGGRRVLRENPSGTFRWTPEYIDAFWFSNTTTRALTTTEKETILAIPWIAASRHRYAKALEQASQGLRLCDSCGVAPLKADGVLADVSIDNCDRCKVAKYCSKKCQVFEWPHHKFVCRVPSKQPSPRHEADTTSPQALWTWTAGTRDSHGLWLSPPTPSIQTSSSKDELTKTVPRSKEALLQNVQPAWVHVAVIGSKDDLYLHQDDVHRRIPTTSMHHLVQAMTREASCSVIEKRLELAKKMPGQGFIAHLPHRALLWDRDCGDTLLSLPQNGPDARISSTLNILASLLVGSWPPIYGPALWYRDMPFYTPSKVPETVLIKNVIGIAKMSVDDDLITLVLPKLVFPCPISDFQVACEKDVAMQRAANVDRSKQPITLRPYVLRNGKFVGLRQTVQDVFSARGLGVPSSISTLIEQTEKSPIQARETKQKTQVIETQPEFRAVQDTANTVLGT